MESSRLILLYPNPNQAVFLEKDGFRKGNAEELLHFLRDKRHIQYKRVK